MRNLISVFRSDFLPSVLQCEMLGQYSNTFGLVVYINFVAKKIIPNKMCRIISCLFHFKSVFKTIITRGVVTTESGF
jgi:hypothetical protein